MTPSTPRELLDRVWQYPLFDALYGRRSRRFGLGFTTAEGPFPYASQAAPLPLSEFEEALLVGAGIGVSGMALWDQSRPLPYRGGEGRTFPSTSHGKRSALFFTNDQATYVIDPGAVSAGQADGIRAADRQERVLALYRDHRKAVRRGRLEIPRRVPPLSGHNLWDSNGRGSTLFMPVCDISQALISLIAQCVDRRLERFAARDGRGMHIVDDRHGFRAAGTEPWVRSGFLDGDRVLPLSHLERQAAYFMFSEPAVICHNIFLATEAIGLGGWMHCGFFSREVFEALGFRVSAANARASLPNPVGCDGIFEAYCPPYFASMDAAVDAVLTPLLGTSGTSEAARGRYPAPHLLTEAEHRDGAVAITAEGIACTKAVCNYIHEVYGRFPGGIDAMHLMWFMQVHHLDTDFYDKFFRPGAYGATHAGHMPTWHGERAGAAAPRRG
jgi:hypothetical protein